jgi:hypothetical protein
VVDIEIKREIKIIIKKYLVDIEESPAIKHNTSSGNIGNKNIIVKNKLSFNC